MYRHVQCFSNWIAKDARTTKAMNCIIRDPPSLNPFTPLPFLFPYVAYEMIVLNRIAYGSCGVARAAARSHRHLPLLRCASSRASGNGHEATSAGADEASRALPGVAWGLAYHDDGANGSYGDKLEPYRSLDAIVVLAGGQTGPDSLPVWVERRLDTALSLQRLQPRPCPILSLGTPGPGGMASRGRRIMLGER